MQRCSLLMAAAAIIKVADLQHCMSSPSATCSATYLMDCMLLSAEGAMSCRVETKGARQHHMLSVACQVAARRMLAPAGTCACRRDCQHWSRAAWQ